MSKYFISPLLFLLVVFSINSQETRLKITESPQFREQVKSEQIIGMLTTSEKEKGIVKFSKEYITIDVFGENLKPLTTSVTKKDKKEAYLSTMYVDDEIKFLTVSWPKRKVREIYAYTFDIKGRKLNKELLLKSEVENPKRGILAKVNNSYMKKSVSSLDGKFFALVLDDFKTESNTYTITVFDGASLDKIYSKSISEDIERFYTLNDINIDNSGTVFLIRKIFKEGKKTKKKKANYEFMLSKITKEAIENKTINDGGKFVRNLFFGLPNESLMLVGFFSEKSAIDLKGVCNYVLNKNDLEITNSRFDALPLDVYKDLFGTKEGEEKEGKELGSSFLQASDGTFYLDHILKDSKGGVYMIAEEFYMTTNTSQMGFNGGMTMTTTFHYDDILVIKYNFSGELEWGRSIYKRSTLPSYNAFVKEDELHIILNSGKNLTEKEDGRTKVSKGFFESSSLYDIVFDKDGNASYDKIQDNKGKNYYLPASGNFSEESFIMINRGSKNNPFRSLMMLE